MRPLTALLGIVMGSAVALAIGLLMTWIVILLLPADEARFAPERAPLLRAIAVFTLFSAAAAAGEPDEKRHHDEPAQQRQAENDQLALRSRQCAVGIAQVRQALQGCRSFGRGRWGHSLLGVAARAGIIAFSCRKSEPRSSAWATWAAFTHRNTRRRPAASSSRSRIRGPRRVNSSPPSSKHAP